MTPRHDGGNGRDGSHAEAGVERPRPAHVPASTYRLQFHRDFTFADAERVVPYLRDLGAADCYTSPYLMARPGSRHGYDITDHTRLNPEVGSEDDFGRFVAALAAHGMGQLLDFVPNHMGVDPLANPWWRDVLENGPSSAYGRFFDIDWDPVKPELRGKVLLPILGDQYGMVLERGELRLAFSDGLLHLMYFDHNLPINPRRSARVYERNVEALVADLTEESAELREFLSIMTELRNLPDYHESDPERIAERSREQQVARDRLARLTADSARIRRHVEEAVKAFNGTPGDPHSFDALHALLEEQPYRLAYWRTASHEINYRRFFDINDLAGIRMENPDVFEATHVLVRRLLAERAVGGLRIDHPDGLYDPGKYFRQLQEVAAADGDATPLYVLAEKILSPGEQLPEWWPIQGTTGYSFVNELNGVFIEQAGGRPLRRIYRRITKQLASFEEVAYACKKLITETSLASELNVLAHALNRLSEAHRRSRDFTLSSLHDALAEVVACFPVYRSYVNPDGWSPADRRVIETAVRRARRRNPALEASAWDFLREVLLPRKADANDTEADNGFDRRVSFPPPDAEEYGERLHFSMRFQQYTAPVQAKGVEDTAFYRYNLLLSLNEVGGDPGRFGVTVAQFHAQNLARLARWPLEMTATATHDTKLGEDVRARVNVLSELVDDWRRVLARWMRINAANRTEVDGEIAPDRNDEYRFYQVVLGSWPVEALDERVAVAKAPDQYVARLRDYMTKAIKEAKVRTSWINDDEAYDAAVVRFVERSLAGPSAARFFKAFLPFARRVAHLGMLGSLSQLALKIACPGVPDFYQGTELWDLHLVDPDNRGAVDYALRRALLDRIRPVLVSDGDLSTPESDEQARLAAIREMLACWTDGRIKLFITATGLRARRAKPDLFLFGEYLPLEADVSTPGGVVAIARRRGDDALIAIAPRLLAKMVESEMPIGEKWNDSSVRIAHSLAGTYRNLLTGEHVEVTAEGLRLDDALRHCPVALLLKAAP